MTEPQKVVEAPQLTKREKRIAAAKQLEKEWEEDEAPSGIYDLSYRSHVAKVLETLGLNNGVGLIDEGWDKRISAGLKPLPLIKLAYDNKLAQALEDSRDEIAEQTIENANQAKLDALKKEQQGAGRGDRRNGPIQRR